MNDGNAPKDVRFVLLRVLAEPSSSVFAPDTACITLTQMGNTQHTCYDPEGGADISMRAWCTVVVPICSLRSSCEERFMREDICARWLCWHFLNSMKRLALAPSGIIFHVVIVSDPLSNRKKPPRSLMYALHHD